MWSDNTARLTNAVLSLSELLEKRLIYMHSSLATSVPDCIRLRRLDVCFELEEKIMSGTTFGVLWRCDPQNGTPMDKLRLFLISV